jgi:beta-fructofuranosidase
VWKKSPSNPVIKSHEWGITELKDIEGKDVHVGSADPSNIWKKNGKYYMLTGSLMVLNKYGRNEDDPPDERGDRLYLFESDDLKDWTYLHRFYDSKREWTATSEDNMCPSFLPLPASAEGGRLSDKYLLLFISHNKGAQYYIGDYRNDYFYPEQHGRMSWTDNSYFAPEAVMDDRKRQIMWSWIFDDRPESLQKYYGWTGVYGLPRALWLAKDGTLGIRPVKELESLRLAMHEKQRFSVRAGKEVDLAGFGSELMEIEATIQVGTAAQVGMNVGYASNGQEQTSIYYDAHDSKLKFDTTRSSIDLGRKVVEAAPLELKKAELLVLHIYVDKGVVEVFANDRQAIARAVYPKLHGTGVRIFSNGGDAKVISIRAWKLAPANPY